MGLNTVRCQYCGGFASINRTHFGWRWECTPCDARVGCHKDTQDPKGSLANAALRAARIAAHQAFDPLWQKKLRLDPTMSKSQARTRAYQWLARMLQVPVAECHIAHFSIPQCMRVVEVCAPFAARARQGAEAAVTASTLQEDECTEQ
jgi:hypothetical protein